MQYRLGSDPRSRPTMNVLFVSPFDLFVSRLWGPTVRLHALAREFAARGHATLLAGPQPRHGAMPAELDSVPLHYFATPFHRYPSTEPSRKPIWRLPWIMLSRARELIGLIRSRNVDVLYVNRAFLDTAYPALAAHWLGRTASVCDWDDIEGLHGFSTSARRRLPMQLVETFGEVAMPRLADATVVASRYLEEFALGINVPRPDVFYAPTVADGTRFRPDLDPRPVRERYQLTGRKVLLYCGNLMAANGVRLENLIHAFRILHATDRTFSLLIVGGGDLLESHRGKGELLRLVEELGLTRDIHFAGRIPQTDVPAHVAAADLCLALFPINVITMSKSPLKVYEYLAAGKPVVARDIGELSHCVVDGENGRFVFSDRPEEYAEVIQQCFASREDLERMGRQARQLFEERFTWRQSADAALAACQHALSKRCRVALGDVG